MLVLGRKTRERVKLTVGGVVVWITVVRLGGPCARLGFDAPDEVVIEREEVARARDAEAFLRRRAAEEEAARLEALRVRAEWRGAS